MERTARHARPSYNNSREPRKVATRAPNALRVARSRPIVGARPRRKAVSTMQGCPACSEAGSRWFWLIFARLLKAQPTSASRATDGIDNLLARKIIHTICYSSSRRAGQPPDAIAFRFERAKRGAKGTHTRFQCLCPALVSTQVKITKILYQQHDHFETTCISKAQHKTDPRAKAETRTKADAAKKKKAARTSASTPCRPAGPVPSHIW